MIRYAIDDDSNYTIKQYAKKISIIVAKPYEPKSVCNHTGIYLWPDGGTTLLVISPYGNAQVTIIEDKQELQISTIHWPQPELRPGTEIATVIPLASAYYGNIELEQIRSEWFSKVLL